MFSLGLITDLAHAINNDLGSQFNVWLREPATVAEADANMKVIIPQQTNKKIATLFIPGQTHDPDVERAHG